MTEPKKRLNDVTPEEWNKAHDKWANESTLVHSEHYYDSDRNKPLNDEKNDTNTDWDDWKLSKTFV